MANRRSRGEKRRQRQLIDNGSQNTDTSKLTAGPSRIVADLFMTAVRDGDALSESEQLELMTTPIGKSIPAADVARLLATIVLEGVRVADMKQPRIFDRHIIDGIDITGQVG